MTMAELTQLSNRERDVVQLLLEGKSNKMIASSLGVSSSTVEFHLKNIYEKFQVSSRMELVLKLGNTTGLPEAEILGQSTVADTGEVAENRSRPDSRNWATSLRAAVSIIGKELRMESALNPNAPSEAKTMTFFESIRTCLAKYAEFNGRASRSEYWWFTLFVTLVVSALVYVSEVWASIFLIAMLLPLLAAGARRLHDSGRSGWWQLFALAPIAGIVVVGVVMALPPTSPLPDDSPSA
jgi:DNA-binding CsgD family transcriptional regulator